MHKAIIRQVKLFIVVMLGYLFQVSVLPYFKIWGIVPSLLCAVIAIVTVGYGKLRALWVGLFYGILMETLLPTVPLLNLMFYPICALFCSVFFADKSSARLQYERSTGKAGRNTSPYLRTLLCAMLNVTIYEVVNVVYMYLNDTALTAAQVQKSLSDILLTTVMTGIIMVPVRKLLGFVKPRAENPEEMRFGYRPDRI